MRSTAISRSTSYKVWWLVSVAYRPPNSYIYSQISVRRLKYTYRGIHIRDTYLLVRGRNPLRNSSAQNCICWLTYQTISSLTRRNEKRIRSYIWSIANDLISVKLFRWKENFCEILPTNYRYVSRTYIIITEIFLSISVRYSLFPDQITQDKTKLCKNLLAF